MYMYLIGIFTHGLTLEYYVVIQNFKQEDHTFSNLLKILKKSVPNPTFLKHIIKNISTYIYTSM